MKRCLLLLLCLCGLRTFVVGQTITIDEFNAQHDKQSKKGLSVLGAIAVANIAGSTAGLIATERGDKYFHAMNVSWNAINLAIAVPAVFFSKPTPQGLSLGESLKRQASTDKTFLFNAGLDMAYIAAGLYMAEKSNNCPSQSDEWLGLGNAVIYNGAILLVFDSIMYGLQNSKTRSFYKQLNNVTLGSGPRGFYIGLRL